MDNYISQIFFMKSRKDPNDVSSILASLDSDKIRQLGRDNVPDDIWLIKKDKTAEEAAKCGNLIGLKYFIDQGMDIHANDDAALRRASEYGHLFMVKYLVGLGANIHANSDEALEISTKNGHSDVAKYLVGLDATSKDEAKPPPATNTDVYSETINYLAGGIL